MRIDEIFAFVALDSDGGEGVCGFLGPEGWMPMVGADQARVDALMPIAQTLATTAGQRIKLLRFTTREEITTITPEEKDDK